MLFIFSNADELHIMSCNNQIKHGLMSYKLQNAFLKYCCEKGTTFVWKLLHWDWCFAGNNL